MPLVLLSLGQRHCVGEDVLVASDALSCGCRVARIRPDRMRRGPDQHQPAVIAVEAGLYAVGRREVLRDADSGVGCSQPAASGKRVVRGLSLDSRLTTFEHARPAAGRVFIGHSVGSEVAYADAVTPPGPAFNGREVMVLS